MNKTFRIKECSQDGFGRTAGLAFVAGKTVNLEMVKAGYAGVYRGNPAARFDSAPYRKVEEAAKAVMKGMWLKGRSM